MRSQQTQHSNDRKLQRCLDHVRQLTRTRKWKHKEGIDRSHSYWSWTHGPRETTHGTYGRCPWLWMVSWRGLGWGRARGPPGLLVVALLRSFGDSGSFCRADFLSDFLGFFGALLMAGKPEIQKQQKTATSSWVHWVNRLVQICSKVYESSSKTWQSHTKHAWSKQKL